MVVDQNFHKVKKFLFLLALILFSTNSFSKNFNFNKITELEAPWGSSFVNDNEMIVTEKGGKIKLLIFLQKR